MWPYWFLFLFPAYMAISRLRYVQNQTVRFSLEWLIVFILLVSIIGLRHEVGGDWGNDWNNRSEGASLLVTIRGGDPGYSLLMWIVEQIGLEIHALDVLSAVPFSWGLLQFCRSQPRPWLALTVAVPYLVIVVAMGYTRQSVAIGLSMIGLVALTRGRVLHFVFWVALAATFHKSAVILVPLAVLAINRRPIFLVFWVGLSTFMLFVLLLQESVDALFTNYVGNEYNSQGAGIRVAMNAIPAVLFLLLRRRFVMPRAERIFWTWMSVGALTFIGLLTVSPSSTAVDRVALFWIPLQLFVLSRLPDALGRDGRKNAVWVYSVVVYAGTVQFVWLFFAQTAYMWVPYQFYPWVWIFE